MDIDYTPVDFGSEVRVPEWDSSIREFFLSENKEVKVTNDCIAYYVFLQEQTKICVENKKEPDVMVNIF